jgi:hypothetical protein
LEGDVPKPATPTRLATMAREKRDKREREREREFNADATTQTEDMKELRVGVWRRGQ